MSEVRIAQSALLDIPAATAYAIIADYRNGHPRILPPDVFVGLEVESGGRGAGTVIRFRMKIGGLARTVRAVIAEPEPGRVLTETDLDTGAVTSFTVDGAPDGSRCHVAIATVWQATGIAGLLARWLAPRMLRRVYADELALLYRVGRADGPPTEGGDPG